MGQPIVHFEIIGKNPARLRAFYGKLFDWQLRLGDATDVSRPDLSG